MFELVQKRYPPKRRCRKLTRGFYQIIRQQTTGLTDPHLELEQKFAELNKLLDGKLEHDFHLPLVNLPKELYTNRPWDSEWFSFHLDLLTRFGQNLVRQSVPNTFHVWIEECIPITCQWDAYLNEKLWDSCDSTTMSMVKDYVWDMYAIMKRPVVCKLTSHGTTTSNKSDNLFLISIPSSPIQTKASTQLSDAPTISSKSSLDFDTYEFVRFKLDLPVDGSIPSRDYISSYHTVQLFDTKFIPQLLDSLANNLHTSSSEPNLKLVEWSRVEGTNLDQLEFKVTFDLSESAKRNSISPYTSRIRLPRAPPNDGSLSVRERSSSNYLIAEQNMPAIFTRSRVNSSQHQPSNLFTLNVRICPVYSLQSILGRSLLTARDSHSGDHSSHARHLFLRPVEQHLNCEQTQLQSDSHSWQICSRLSDAYLLDKIDLVDRGCRRQAARIVMLFGQIQDAIKPCGLTRHVNQKTLKQICLQHLFGETNQTCTRQFEFLFHCSSKPLAWQRSRLLRCIQGMIEQLYHALSFGKLIPFNSVETNLIHCQTKLDRVELKASSQCVRAWLHSDNYLQMILNLALNRLRALDLNSPDSIHLPSIFEEKTLK